VRSECPKTCKNPDGNYDCGEKTMTEGCFCKNGYVEGDNSVCILEKDCGCSVPNDQYRMKVIDYMAIFNTKSLS
jgi:hypothetical protein